jgi:hypothetical protein
MEDGKMKVRDAGVVACVALATLLVSLGLWHSLGQAVAKEKKAPQPKLEVDGVTITLQADKTTYQAGEKPVLVLTAANSAGSPASLTATVRAMSMQLQAMVSRRMPAATNTWQAPCEIALGPNETKKFTITAPKGLQAASTAMFTVQVGKAARTLASASVPGAPLPAQGKAQQMQVVQSVKTGKGS